MSLVYDVSESDVKKVCIKVIGVGGGGCNAINNMVRNSVSSVEFISANTDFQSLSLSQASRCIQLGEQTKKGNGAGGDPEVGRQAAEESRELIADALRGAHLVFIATGMGGGTGTGATPVVAQIAKELGILTVAVVTRPFAPEGRRRIELADKGIRNLKGIVDSIIVVSNDRLSEFLDGEVSVIDAFKEVDNILRNAILGIVDVIGRDGIINTDFSDVEAVMKMTGIAIMGIGTASGEDRARKAAELATSSPLLDGFSLQGARGILVNMTTAPGRLKLSEYNEIIRIVGGSAHPDAYSKYGTAEDENVDPDEICVTIIATGLQDDDDLMNTHAGSIGGGLGAGSLSGTLSAAHARKDESGFGSILQSNRAGSRSRPTKLSAADFSDPNLLESLEKSPSIARYQSE